MSRKNCKNRIVWSEGMFLTPHHFQQWDGYLQGEMQFRQEAASPFAWGVLQMQIDPEALANGRFALDSLVAVLPDGTAVRAYAEDAVDPLPSSRPFAAHFAADQVKLEVFLALPEARSGVSACSLPDRPLGIEPRHVGELRRVDDLIDPNRESEVLAARQNLKILFGGESLDGYTLLKIAEVERSAEGVPVLSKDYAPPSLAISAVGPAPAIMRLVHENLVASSLALSQQLNEYGDGTRGFNISDVTRYGRLSIVDSFIPVLAHFQRVPRTHPATVYLALAQLAGALCTFTTERHPREVPPYDHEALGPTYRALEAFLVPLLRMVERLKYTVITLERQPDNEALLIGAVSDDRLLDPQFEWYLKVSGDLSPQVVRDSVPTQVLIGSPHNIGYLITRATPGLVPVHLPVPPKEFPFRADQTFFRLDKRGLDKRGTVWEAVREAHAVAVYLGSQQLLGLNVEIVVMD